MAAAAAVDVDDAHDAEADYRCSSISVVFLCTNSSSSIQPHRPPTPPPHLERLLLEAEDEAITQQIKLHCNN
jgi:hypothetical protein